MSEKNALNGFLRALAIGVACSAVVWSLAGLWNAWWTSHVRETSREALVQVLVANVDLAPDAQLTPEMVSPRSLPPTMVTANSITPEGLTKLVGLYSLHGIEAGTPLRWTDVGPARAMVKVVFANRDIGAGQRLTESNVVERDVWSSLPTDSWFRDKASVIGLVTKTKFGAGEPILSTHFAEK